MVLQARCTLTLSFLEVPHQGTRLVEAGTTERAVDVVGVVKVVHRVLR
jgi:hypothetical protein